MPNLLTKKAVCEKIGFSRAHVDRFTNDPEYIRYRFPKPVRIGIRVLWPEHEIDDWIDEQLAKRPSQ